MYICTYNYIYIHYIDIDDIDIDIDVSRTQLLPETRPGGQKDHQTYYI